MAKPQPKGVLSFERINSLITVQRNKILKNEMNNENRINLYDVGDFWVAFEKSAYLLKQMVNDDDEPIILHFRDYPFPIIMHSVHYELVYEMCQKRIMTKRTLEYLQFMTKPIDEESYKVWYRELVLD